MKDISKLHKVFSTLPPAVFNKRDLQSFFKAQREQGTLPQSATYKKVATLLEELEQFQKITLICPYYDKQEERYTWKTPSIFQIALSLKGNSYLSHGSAVYLHGMNDERPFRIYLNQEQSPKPAPQKESLTQERIDQAFANKQRESKLIYTYDQYEIMVVNGKNTNNLEVKEMTGEEGEQLKTTSIERTLIDIAVRPNYAGGPQKVIEAYQGARTRTSINVLIGTLKKLDYVYPYHQSIGFYMEKAGWDEKIYSRLLKFGTEFNFYLTYGMKEPLYNSRWNIFYPQGI